MKMKFVPVICILFLLQLGSFVNKAKANHEIGSTITYLNVAPNTYQVTLHMYRDCTGAPSATTHTLNLRAPGCHSGRDITLTKVGAGRTGDPYCPTIGNSCASTARPNYEVNRYEGIVAFSIAEQSCSYWFFSAVSTANSRPASENVVGNTGMYNEAFLRIYPNAINNSAQINAMDDPAPVFCFGQEIQYVLNATDPDCDSLSYELVTPLAGISTPVTYKPVNAASPGTIVNPNPKPPFNTTTNQQIATIPNFGLQFRPDFPLVSVKINWDNQPVVTGELYFKLDPKKGVLRFIPSMYSHNVSASNKYFVTVEIKEWRNLNGVMTNMGAIRRDLMFRIEDCAGNNLPSVSPPFIPGNPFTLDTTGIINVRPGTQLNLQFTTSDPDPNSVLTVESDVMSVLPGAQLSLTTASHPVGTISWLATAHPTCNAVRYYRVRVSDNACPIKGKQDFLVGIRVSANAAPLASGKEAKAPGLLVAYPNPFSDEISFKLEGQQKGGSLVIYNVLGQQVDQLPLKGQVHSEQDVVWTNAARFPAGQYLVRFSGASAQCLKINKLP